MKFIAIAVCAFAVVATAGLVLAKNSPALSQMGDVRTPVVVELFTSEGCSSCPPADKLLQSLVKNQPIKGVEVIALEEHVDYWDHLGWRDPYSSAQFTQRQNTYAAQFHSDDIYTPEMVVAGKYGFVGSDSGEATEKISDASKQIARNEITPQIEISGDAAAIKVPASSSVDRLAVLAAITEDGLSSKVTDGENGGHTLTHIATVRSLTEIGVTTPNMLFTGKEALPTSTGKRHLVVFVQDRNTKAIRGAAEIDLN